MKRILLLLSIILLLVTRVYCQKFDVHETENRLDSLASITKEYKNATAKIAAMPRATMLVRTIIRDSLENDHSLPSNIVRYELGYYETKPNDFIPLYYFYYSIRDRKIARISKHKQ